MLAKIWRIRTPWLECKLVQLLEGNGIPLQYSCLENPTDGGAWWAAVHGVAKSRTGLSDFTFTVHFHSLEKEMAPHSSALAWKIHGRRSLVGCSSWGRKESDKTERLHFYFLLSCIGEGNGNPLQCSCLENPRDSGAWWAAVCGVAQSQIQLKQISSSSSIMQKQFGVLLLLVFNINEII